MKKKATAMPRMNSRVRVDQQKFIRTLAKKDKKTHGELIREIIDYYIKNKK